MFSPPPPKSEVSLEFSSQKLLWAFLSYAYPTNTTIEITTLKGLLTEEQKEMATEILGAVDTTDWIVKTEPVETFYLDTKKGPFSGHHNNHKKGLDGNPAPY